jgi:uncharacterized membrane protein
VSLYTVIKFLHILVAIIAVGSSAGSSFWLRLAMDSPANLPFALRTARFMDNFVTRPGLAVLLLTGLWMAATHWTLSILWVRAAIVLVVAVLVLLFTVVGPVHRRLIRAVESAGRTSPQAKRLELMFELAGGGAGLLILLVVWLMVAKPA